MVLIFERPARGKQKEDLGSVLMYRFTRVHKGITIVISLFMSHWLAVVYCLVFCIGSC